MRNRLGISLAMASCMAFVGCNAPTRPATVGLQQDPLVNKAWPEAPDSPRVRYVNSLVTNAPWLATQGEYVSFPRAVAVDDARQRLYVSEQHGVRVVNLATGEMGLMANQAVNAVQVAHGIAVAPDGRIFVVDATKAAIVVYSPDNEYLMQISGFVEPKGLTIDKRLNRLYVADAAANQVKAFSLDGTFLFAFRPSDETPFALPLQVAVNSQSLVYVLNWRPDSMVQIFDTQGNFLRSFGIQGNSPSQFNRPKGIAIDGDDNVYVADSAFGNIQVFDSQDRLCMFFGEGGGDPGQFNIPGFMTIDSSNRIFVPEYGSHRVQVLQYLQP